MLFNSLQFLVFFLVVTLWFFRLKEQKSRNLLLLLASCYFYMSFVPWYILILGATIVIDYFAGIQIARSGGHKRKLWLVASIIANVGILAYYKYCNFFIDNINILFSSFDSSKHVDLLKIILPIGLSFHTFQAMSYTIEVYRANQPPERHFLTYALYVMFYPQLVAGPIERPQNILPQLHEYRPYNWDNVKQGLARMLWGFFKKVVIADRLGILVDHVYGYYGTSSWIVLFVGAVFYSFQIYCDFSGYCDIGIGAAKVMNIRLMENFTEPYLSNNIHTFWQRWHISLSSWFRDYVYIPLGGNRKGEMRRRLNVFVVFLLSGLWHGANWTFVIWGFLHGMLVMLLPGKYKRREPGLGYAAWAIVNFGLVTLLWIFFRSANIANAYHYIKGIFTLQAGDNNFGMNGYEMIFAAFLVVIMLIKEHYVKGYSFKSDKRFYWYVAMMVVVCYSFGVFEENQFIYFQF